MRVNRLDWNDNRREHIARHKVSIEEAEDIAFGKHYAIRTKQGRYRLIGQTGDGRYLVVVLQPGDYGWFEPITARDATQNERRLYLKKVK